MDNKIKKFDFLFFFDIWPSFFFALRRIAVEQLIIIITSGKVVVKLT